MNAIKNKVVLHCANNSHAVDFESWPIEWLANYIEKKQRKTINENGKTILQKIIVTTKRCNSSYSTDEKFKNSFVELLSQLSVHMRREEAALFPFIRKMLQAKETNRNLQDADFCEIESTIEILNDEHCSHINLLKPCMQSSVYHPLPVLQNRFHKHLYNELITFEQDLELHIYLQTMLLFPKILAVKYEVI